MAVKTDKKTLELIKEVQRRKEEIDAINLHVEASVKNLICIAAFLKDKEEAYAEVAQELGVADVPAFTWNGSSVAEWIADIKARINKIQIAAKKKQLETLEARLGAIVSPELRAELELEAIAKELV